MIFTNSCAHADRKIKQKILFACISLIALCATVMFSIVISNNANADTNNQNEGAITESEAIVSENEALAESNTLQSSDVNVDAVFTDDQEQEQATVVNDNKIKGQLRAGTGAENILGDHPYVWPVGMVNGQFYVGGVDYNVTPVSLAVGEYSVEVPVGFEGVIVTGADMRQTSIHYVDNMAQMEPIYLPLGNTCTVNYNSEGFKGVTLKKESSIIIPFIGEIPLTEDFPLDNNLPAIGFDMKDRDASMIDFQDDGKAIYIYNNIVSVNAIIEATPVEDYSFQRWENEFYPNSNSPVPATTVKVINPVFSENHRNISGQLRPGTGASGYLGDNPYVWAIGSSNNEYYIGDINYNIDNEGYYSLQLPKDFIGVIVAGADMRQTSAHFAVKQMDPIYLPLGNTCTFNYDSEGFNSVVLKADSKLTIFNVLDITLDKDYEFTMKLPSVGFAQDISNLEFYDDGTINYTYNDSAIKADATFEVTAQTDYYFDCWNNAYYSDENAVIPATDVEIINPVFAKSDVPVPVPPEPQPGSNTGSNGAQTSDNLPINILAIVGVLFVAVTVFLTYSRRRTIY